MKRKKPYAPCSSIAGKKLLILGANAETVPLIETAQTLGVYVIVTDNNPEAFAKPFADQACNVDGLDVAGLVKLAQEEEVDGLLVGVADRLIVPYQQVCEALKLPCYATAEQCQVFTDKGKFNDLCARYGIPTIPSFSLDNDFSPENLEKLIFPVLVKPADANSGKGMSVCRGISEVRRAVDLAIGHSRSRRFLIERFMECEDMFIYFTFADGEIYVSATADRYTCRAQGDVSPVCLGGSYPSKHTDLYFATLHEKLCRMFRDLKVQNGVFMVAGFVYEGVIHLYDPGFRLQGEAPELIIIAANGFDQKEMLIRFALTGSMSLEKLEVMNDCRLGSRQAATVWFLAKEGMLVKIEGLLEANNDAAVIQVAQRLYEGDNISSEMVGTEAQVLARVYLLCDSKEELRQKVEWLQQKIKAYDEDGARMLLNGFRV